MRGVSCPVRRRLGVWHSAQLEADSIHTDPFLRETDRQLLSFLPRDQQQRSLPGPGSAARRTLAAPRRPSRVARSPIRSRSIRTRSSSPRRPRSTKAVAPPCRADSTSRGRGPRRRRRRRWRQAEQLAGASEALQVFDQRGFVVAAELGAKLAAFVAAVVVAGHGGVEPPAVFLGLRSARHETDVVEIVDVVADVEDLRPHRLWLEQRTQRRHGPVVQIRRAKPRPSGWFA